MPQPKFIPRTGQVDYTNIRYCPVINCVLQHGAYLLLVRRSNDLRLYPGYWSGISGYLDDQQSVEEKAYEELAEELNLFRHEVVSIHRGQVFAQKAVDYGKTWIVFPVLVTVKTRDIGLDWEAESADWVLLDEARRRPLLPGFDQVLAALFP